jgi:hypothetical protein
VQNLYAVHKICREHPVSKVSMHGPSEGLDMVRVKERIEEIGSETKKLEHTRYYKGIDT